MTTNDNLSYKRTTLNAEKAMDIVSRLLNADISKTDDDLRNLLKKAKDCFYGTIYGNIANSEFPEKKGTIDGIKSVFDEEYFCTEFDQVLGKGIVGLVGIQRESDLTFLKRVFGIQTAEWLMKINHVPVVVYQNGNKKFFVNDVGKHIELNAQECIDAVALMNYNIDIAGFVKYFCMPMPPECQFKNLIFIYMSKESYKRCNSSCRRFLDRLDFLVYIKPENLEEFEIKKYRHNNCAVEYIVSQIATTSALSYQQLLKQLREQDRPQYDAFFALEIENKLSSAICYHKNTIDALKNDVNLGESDLVKITDDSLKRSVTEFLQECKNKKTRYEEELLKISADADDLLSICRKYDSCKLKKIHSLQIDDLTYRSSTFELLGKLFFKYIDCGYFDRATVIYNQLHLYGYKNLFVCDIALLKGRGRSPIRQHLDELSKIVCDDNITIRVKIRCSQEINFDVNDYINSSLMLPDFQDLSNPNELLFYGLAQKNERVNKKIFTNALRKAALYGSREAAIRLEELAHNNPAVRNMIGYDMIPGINYYRATVAEQEGNRFLANVFFKLAASQGEFRSIKKNLLSRKLIIGKRR